MMVYLYPVDSKNYDDTEFGTLAEEIIFWNNLGYTLYIGGDCNARLGDLNVISENIFHWKYDNNIDNTVNPHGKRLRTICGYNGLSPSNHCHYYGKPWDGNYTYCKGGKQSQIDFCFSGKKRS